LCPATHRARAAESGIVAIVVRKAFAGRHAGTRALLAQRNIDVADLATCALDT
jgi:hypothetical protein